MYHTISYHITYHNVHPTPFTENKCSVSTANLEHAVAQLVEALRYKPEGRGFDFR